MTLINIQKPWIEMSIQGFFCIFVLSDKKGDFDTNYRYIQSGI